MWESERGDHRGHERKSAASCGWTEEAAKVADGVHPGDARSGGGAGQERGEHRHEALLQRYSPGKSLRGNLG